MRRETLAISKGGRALLQGRGTDIATRETASQILQRVMPDLMGMKNILVLNDEAHHCYREKPAEEDNATLELTPDVAGPSITRNEGIVGEGVDLSLEHLEEMRPSTVVFHLTKRLLETKWRDPGEEPKLHLFGQLKRITRQWLKDHLVCKGGTYPAQLPYQSLADTACERITRGIVARHMEERPVQAVLDAYNPVGSTMMDASVIEEYPHDKYSPSCLLLGFTRTGRPLDIQVSLADTGLMRIVTLYEPRATEWTNHSRRR